MKSRRRSTRRSQLSPEVARAELVKDRMYAVFLREVETVSRGHADQLVKLCAEDMELGQEVLATCAALIQWARVDERKKYLAKVGG